MSSISKLWRKLRNKTYRDGYTEAQLSIEIPFQIRALRKARGWTQTQLAERCGIPQARISHIEQPGRDPLSLRTLYRLASAFDVGLLVQFVSFTELVRREAEFNPEIFRVASFKTEMDNRFFNTPILNSPCEERSKTAIAIFRTISRRDVGNAFHQIRTRLHEELHAGRLRQGWGCVGNGASMALRDEKGARIPRDVWEENYRRAKPHRCWTLHPKRYDILSRMLELRGGDVVIVPKMPTDEEFSVARVNGPYTFQRPDWPVPCADGCADGHVDFGHIISVDPASVEHFARGQNSHTSIIAGIIKGAPFMSAVNIANNNGKKRREEMLIKALQGLGYL